MSSREEALHRLEAFLDQVPAYERTRNFDRHGHTGVSRLSHWIRYRVITEEECVRAVLKRHSLEAAEKFLQEILWRTYWKGWLEMRPAVWSSYLSETVQLTEDYRDNETYKTACKGRTHLSFFNDWTQELVNTGYLHNHTRMWFASVWIFTLKLPWQLGAAFMYHHLLDGDPASNTLSWRWVGGLHTPGKIYVARPDNIAKFSEGRWNPKDSELALDPTPLPIDMKVEMSPLREVSTTPPAPGSLVLMHDDDLSADATDQFSSRGVSYAVLDCPRTFQSENVQEHVSALRNDAARRAKAPLISSAEELVLLAQKVNAKDVHAFLPPIGHEGLHLHKITDELSQGGIPIVWHRRPWDARLMPLARAGFFGFWERARAGLAGT